MKHKKFVKSRENTEISSIYLIHRERKKKTLKLYGHTLNDTGSCIPDP